MSKASQFYSENFKDLFLNFKNSYYGVFKKQVNNSGGRASGKSHQIIDNLVFWLPEVPFDEAIIVCYSSRHKLATSELVQEKLYSHGYSDSYKTVLKTNGDISYYFANKNIITVMSAESKQLIQMVERMKNIQFVNSKFKKQPLKYLFFEEFTATLNVFKELDKTINAISSFNRHMNANSMIMYNYNPPPNKKHLVYKFMDMHGNDILNIKSTIYDLREDFQSLEDIKLAEKLKISNNKQWLHIYMGEPVSEDGLAFEIREDIWKQLENEYKKFYIQTDEGTLNATTFGLFGMNYKGELHFITNYYHSSKIDGIKKSPSTYAYEFNKWYDELDVEVDMIVTDGLAFSQELKKYGFKSKSIGSLKDRALSYHLLDKLVTEKNFKIIDRPENIILYEQMSNAIIEYNSKNKPIISKKAESGNDNTKHSHALDLCLYMCLRLQKLILRGNKF